jgi:uncharacterized membrane protein YhaH (DUF805 family)
VGRGRFAEAVFFSLYPVTAMAGYRGSEPHAYYVVVLVLAILWVPLWGIASIGRLTDLRWNRWLALLLVLPWCVFMSVISRMSVRAFFIALSALIAVQLPLMFIPGQTQREAGKQTEQLNP